MSISESQIPKWLNTENERVHIVIYFVNLQLVTLSRQFVFYIYVKIST